VLLAEDAVDGRVGRGLGQAPIMPGSGARHDTGA
jgi:hypothetical protein